MRPGVRFLSDAAAPDWSRVPPCGHGVQFYRDDDQLVRLLARYVGSALIGGDVALVVARRRHRTALDRRLAARGLDVAVARREGRYITADAQKMIDAFLVDGRVDAAAARGAVLELLNRAAAASDGDGGPAQVFAFGEMVSLLVEQGGPDQAIRLEEVWNSLLASHNFTLCCGYRMADFSARHAAPFVRICAMHSHVFHAPDVRHA